MSLAAGVARNFSVCIAAQDLTLVKIAPTDQGGDITYEDVIVVVISLQPFWFLVNHRKCVPGPNRKLCAKLLCSGRDAVVGLSEGW